MFTELTAERCKTVKIGDGTYSQLVELYIRVTDMIIDSKLCKIVYSEWSVRSIAERNGNIF